MLALGIILVSFDAKAQQLHSKTYRSSCGAFSLRVDPTESGGAGAAHYTLTREDTILWSSTLPVALWEVALASDGKAYGFAYPEGIRRVDGVFRVMAIDARGEVIFQVDQRRSEGDRFTHLAAGYPQGKCVVLHEDLDRFLVPLKTAAGPDSINMAPWQLYDGTTGKRVSEDIVPESPWSGEVLHLNAADGVPGTGLTLVHWLHWQTGRPAPEAQSTGCVFSLHDQVGRVVWALRREGEYAMPGDREAEFALFQYATDNGGILGVSSGGVFELWLPSQRISSKYRVALNSNGDWQVEVLNRQPYCPEALFPDDHRSR